MNYEQIKGLIERGAYMLVMWLVAKGYVPQDVAADVVLGIVTVFAIFWGWKVNTEPSLVQATAGLPSVDRVVVDNKKVAADLTRTDAKVTTS